MIYLNIENPSLSDLEYTTLSAPASPSDTVLNVVSGKYFNKGDILLIGDYGAEASEIVYVSQTTAPTTTQITLQSGLQFSHSANTPVRLMPYDKFRIYISYDNGQSYNLADTIPIQVDSVNTVYISSASGTALFKVASYNSITTVEGALSEALAGAGLDFDAAGAIIDRVYDIYNDPNKEFLPDSQIVMNYLNEGYSDLWTRVAEVEGQYLTTYKDINVISGIDTYDLPSDFLKLEGVKLDKNFIKPYDLLSEPDIENSGDYRYMLLGNKIVIKPVPNKNMTMRIYYIPQATLLSLATDKIQLPSSYTAAKLLTDYCVARIYEKAYKTDRASYFLQAFENGVSAYLASIARRKTDFNDFVHQFNEGLENWNDYNF
ncbi:MAG: hypothetical protein ACP5J8_02445 [Minisyncoccia bacterium]